MKTTGTRSLILFLLTGGFLVGLVIFLASLVMEGGNWAFQPYNKHLAGGGQLSYAGDVLDRNGTILAQSKDGERLYNDDEMVRRATLHAVGDTMGYISTGVQYSYRSELAGYNIFTGLATPTGKTTGNDIRLTLDSNLSKVTLQAFGNQKGAAILYNYRTGEVLCMVSSPTFDPGNVPADLNTDTSGKYEGVYLNRALSASYTPGSIFKIVTSAAAIENIPDLESRIFDCPGEITVNGNKVTCLSRHGKIHFQDGLAKSCNIVFAELAMELGKEKMTAEAASMGFNRSFDLDGIPTSKSQYDVSEAQENDLAWSGVGQYTDLTNPYHMMLLMGAIANEGTPVKPYLIESITTHFGLVTKAGRTQKDSQLLQADTAAKLKEVMRYNVTSEYGDNMFPDMEVCAKTGTAEVGGGKKPNAWMVGFSSNDRTPYAFAVVVENGNSGIGAAGGVASAMMAEAAKIPAVNS